MTDLLMAAPTRRAKPRVAVRLPGVIDLSELPVTRAVEARERQFRAAAWPMLAAGIAATPIGPALMLFRASLGLNTLVEALLWGPRMISSARARLREHVPPAVLTDGAATIAYLRHFANGVGTGALPTIQPAAVLDYLVSRGWVGVSDAGDHVWLLADSRRALGWPIQ